MLVKTLLTRWLLAVACAFTALLLVAPAQADAGLIAPRAACSGQQDSNAPASKQKDSLRCLINYARAQAGVRQLSSNGSLQRAAGRKAGDVMRCGFTHTACGRPFDKWAQEYGYARGAGSWRFGENLAWGKGGRSAPRQILQAWLNSPPHRSTLLSGSFEHLGLGLRHGRFSGRSDVGVWVMQVGCRGC